MPWNNFYGSWGCTDTFFDEVFHALFPSSYDFDEISWKCMTTVSLIYGISVELIGQNLEYHISESSYKIGELYILFLAFVLWKLKRSMWTVEKWDSCLASGK